MVPESLARLKGYIDTHQWGEAWTEFERLQPVHEPTALFLGMGSHAAFGRRDLVTARRLVEKAMDSFRPDDPPKLLGQLRFHYGVVALYLGDTHVAQEQFRSFLDGLPQYPELSMGEGKAYFYLAFTQRQRRDLEGAVAAYDRAAECCRRDDLPTLLCAVLQNQSWLLTSLGRLDEARVRLSEACQLVSSDVDRIHQMLGEAYLDVERGRHPAALERCAEVFRRSERGEAVPSEALSQAAWIAGLVALRDSQPETALTLADIALDHAMNAQDGRLMNDANSLRQQALLRKQPGA